MALTREIFLEFHGQTIQVVIKAIDAALGSRFNDEVMFEISFETAVVYESECEGSKLLLPSPPIETQFIDLMTSAEPTILTIPELLDTGTQTLSAISGLVV